MATTPPTKEEPKEAPKAEKADTAAQAFKALEKAAEEGKLSLEDVHVLRRILKTAQKTATNAYWQEEYKTPGQP